MAIIEFPSSEAAQRWYASPENQAAAKVRQSGATFRIVTIQGLPRETAPYFSRTLNRACTVLAQRRQES